MNFDRESGNIPDHIQALLKLIDGVAFHNAALKVPSFYWSFTIQELEEIVKPSKTARQLREVLWKQITRATVIGSGKIKLSELCDRADCTAVRAYQLLKDQPGIIVWLLHPLHDLQADVSPILSVLLDKVCDLVHLPTTDDKGRPIPKNVDIILKAMDLLWRKQG